MDSLKNIIHTGYFIDRTQINKSFIRREIFQNLLFKKMTQVNVVLGTQWGDEGKGN